MYNKYIIELFSLFQEDCKTKLETVNMNLLLILIISRKNVWGSLGGRMRPVRMKKVLRYLPLSSFEMFLCY